MSDLKLGFIGGGVMAQAMAVSFIKSGFVKAENCIASARSQKTLEIWKDWGCQTTFDNNAVVQKSEFIMIGVKPHQVAATMAEVSENMTSNHVIISIANGIKIELFETFKQAAVVRTLPNTPCAVGAGVTAYSRGKYISDENVQKVHQLLKTTGYCVEVEEQYIDIISALSGSGPAYIYVMISALADGAVKCGLPRKLSHTLAANMVAGAAKMVIDSGKHPDQLKDEVCSPGGSTIQAIHEMEKNAFRHTMISAIEAAVKKSRSEDD